VTPFDIFPYTDWLERSGLSRWIREESLWAFPIILIFHTVGLAFLAGANVAFDARILGVARGVPLPSMLPFFRAMWIGFWVNAVSGLLLLITYPTKAVTNPVFYLKLGFITIGLVHAEWTRRDILRNPAFGENVESRPSKLLAAVALFCWLAAITAGRLLAYTYSHIMAYEGR
jgi:hypothetical protein